MIRRFRSTPARGPRRHLIRCAIHDHELQHGRSNALRRHYNAVLTRGANTPPPRAARVPPALRGGARQLRPRTARGGVGRVAVRVGPAYQIDPDDLPPVGTGSAEARCSRCSRCSRWQKETSVPWSRVEIDAFASSMVGNGRDLEAARAAVGTRSRGEVVSYYYRHWKHSTAYAAWRATKTRAA